LIRHAALLELRDLSRETSSGRYVVTRATMDFLILGPLEVTAEGRALPLGGRQQRALLVLLLLHVNEVVSSERLIDEIWGEHPPDSAANMLHVYVSRLRKLFAGADGATAVLATQPPGYALRLVDPAAQLDSHRFEHILEDGRRALSAGDAEAARTQLGDALRLWRGPPLAEFAYEPFAQAEIARLEERRLAALEARIEAEFALGAHADVVAELEELVARYPLRERLRGQLMLALYRSDRQAEALRAYQETRRAFAEELGLEPSRTLQELERAILRHDATLNASSPPNAASVAVTVAPRPWTVSRRKALLALTVALLLASAAAIVALSSDGTSDPVTLAGNSVVVIDPATNAVVGEVPVGGRPSAVAVGEGSVWVGNRDDETLLRIDPRSRKVLRTIGLGAEPSDIEVGAGAVWVTSEADTAVLSVDTALNDVVARIDLPKAVNAVGAFDVAEGGQAVWVLHGGGLARIDAARNVAVHRATDTGLFPEAHPARWRMAFGERELWLIETWSDRLLRIDPSSSTILESIRLAGVGPTADVADVAADADVVWVANQEGRKIWKIDAHTGRVSGLIDLNRRPSSIATGDDGVWAAATDGTVSRIDPQTSQIVKAIPLGVYPVAPEGAIAVGEGAVWVAVGRP
jgi:YVTN family beta-propeller protein